MCFGRKSVAPNRMQNFVLPRGDNQLLRRLDVGKIVTLNGPSENRLRLSRIVVEHAMDFHRDPGSTVVFRRPQVDDLAVVREDYVCERV